MNQCRVQGASNGDAVCTRITKDLTTSDIATNFDGIDPLPPAKVVVVASPEAVM